MALAFIVLNDGDFYNSIYDGINSGRDTDSIGVMTGVILGAIYGVEVIKKEEIRLLEETNKTNFTFIAEQFAEVAEIIIKEDLTLNQKRMSIFE